LSWQRPLSSQPGEWQQLAAQRRSDRQLSHRARYFLASKKERAGITPALTTQPIATSPLSQGTRASTQFMPSGEPLLHIDC
jgi:hypothetical protein